jgi:hypothetical protein
LRLTDGDPLLYWNACVRLYGKLGARAQQRNENTDLFGATLRKYVATATAYDLASWEALRALSGVDPSDGLERIEALLHEAREGFQRDCYQREAECARYNSQD